MKQIWENPCEGCADYHLKSVGDNSACKGCERGKKPETQDGSQEIRVSIEVKHG